MKRAALPRVTPLRRTGDDLAQVIPLHRREPLARVTPLRPRSTKTVALLRERRKMIAALFPGRPACVRCGESADDVHEPKFRSRGGAVTDPVNAVPVCRTCHDWIHEHPAAARKLKLARNSWDDGGDAA